MSTARHLASAVGASTLLDLVDLYAEGEPSRGPGAILGVQARTGLREEVVLDYLDLLVEGTELPPIGVLHSPATGELIVWDGYHRLEAHRRAGRLQIAAHVEEGDSRAALLRAAGANAGHGLRRSHADTRRAVLLLLEDGEFSRWSDRAIAERARVHHSYVGRLRRELAGASGADASAPRIGRDGREIRTEAIASANRARSVADEVEAGLQAERDAADRIAALPPDDAAALRHPHQAQVDAAFAALADDDRDVGSSTPDAVGQLRPQDEAPVEAELPPEQRAALDAYWTPPRTALACVDFVLDLLTEVRGGIPGLEVGPDGAELARIVEPSVGGGSWVDAIRVLLPRATVDRVDVDEQAPGLSRDRRAAEKAHVGDWCGPAVDLLAGTRWWQAVLGNPPYGDLVIPHAEAALRRAPVVALLLRETITGTEGRLPWWRQHRPACVAKVIPRPRWQGPGSRKPSDYSDTVLVVWIRGWTGATRFGWIDTEIVAAGLVGVGEEE